MAISFDRYIEITSGVGAGAAVDQRDLIARLFTTNVEQPTNSIVEFTDATQVVNYYGSNTDEARRAAFYFGFTSKIQTRPNRISFARWADAISPVRIFGAPVSTTLTAFQAITDGAFDITIGSTTTNVSSLNFSTDTSLTDVATRIGGAIAGSTVTYDAPNTRYNLVGTTTGSETISVAAPGAGTNLLPLIGWTSDARFSNGSPVQTVTEVLTASTALSNNFGSFAFVPTLTEAEVTESAMWNNTNNVLFIYSAPVLAADASTYATNVGSLAGTSLTIQQATAANEYHEMLPMAVLAATDYRRRSAVQNYMFQQAALTPTVTTDTDADSFDNLRINYYGRTQSAGQNLDFYQRGVLMGTATSPLNWNTFANEIWLKDFAGSRLMALLLALPRVPANAAGRGQVLAVLRGVVNDALENGTISVGRILTDQQIVFIEQQTGDPNAYQQVQTSGYWLDAVISSEVVASVTNFIVTYTLIYAKDEVIRKVEGTHTLI